MTDHYRDYFRSVDQWGILHLATGAMRPSQAFCGEPPIGNQWDDPAPEVTAPGQLTRSYLTVCPECTRHIGVPMADATTSLDLAQSKLLRSVSRWARDRRPGEGSAHERDLYAAFHQLQLLAGEAFNDAAKQDVDGEVAAPKSPYFTGTPAPAGLAINTAHPRDPLAETARFPYDVATEARIANLLAVVNYPHPIPSGDLVRKAAVARALAMLGLDTVPTT